jgi:hypothetical protein
MYGLDFTKCTAFDVIRRSALCHPTMFRDALCDVASIHAKAAATMHDCMAHRAALDMHKAAMKVAEQLAGGDEPHDLSISERIIAFSAAARLQCIPHATAAQIAGR